MAENRRADWTAEEANGVDRKGLSVPTSGSEAGKYNLLKASGATSP
jgi:hypothetical protein